MDDRIQLPFSFDPSRLENDLGQLAEDDWIPHFVAQNYDGDWSVIPLRGPAGATHPVMQIYSDPGCEDFADTRFLRKCGYFQEVLAQFHCPLQAVRLMRLGAGSVIHEHRDYDLDLDSGAVRLHIVISTHDKVRFRLNGSIAQMQAGGCYYLRLSDPHSVSNTGEQARVHLVIDALANDWLTTLLRGSGE